MATIDRRRFLKTSGLAGAALAMAGQGDAGALGIAMDDIPRGERPERKVDVATASKAKKNTKKQTHKKKKKNQ